MIQSGGRDVPMAIATIEPLVKPGRAERQLTRNGSVMAISEDLLGVAVSLAPGRVIIGVCGELDTHTAGALHGAATAAMKPDVSLIVDLAEVTFIDSAGLGTLVALANLARDGDGEFHLQYPPPDVRRLLEIAGLVEALPVREALPVQTTEG
jgi:anti-anti-sigma factor